VRRASAGTRCRMLLRMRTHQSTVTTTPRNRTLARTRLAAAAGGAKEVKKETMLGLSVKKSDEFSKWYSELVVNSELISYYDVSGE
jgi:hypothetical protein